MPHGRVSPTKQAHPSSTLASQSSSVSSPQDSGSGPWPPMQSRLPEEQVMAPATHEPMVEPHASPSRKSSSSNSSSQSLSSPSQKSTVGSTNPVHSSSPCGAQIQAPAWQTGRSGAHSAPRSGSVSSTAPSQSS